MGMNAEYLRHIQEAEKAGNTAGAQLLRGQLEVFNAARDAGVVQELPPVASKSQEKVSQRVEQSLLPTPEALVVLAKKEWKAKDIPTPPEELFTVWERGNKEGVRGMEPFFYPNVTLTKRSRFPGKGIKPEDWFWEQMEKGTIDQDAGKLPGMWVLLDSTQKPNYDDGRQMYEEDALFPVLKRGREEGRIQITDWTKHVPVGSRFGVSADEVNTFALPEVATLLGVKREQVSMPREIEFNVAGNARHPEWGQTNTWEWMADRFGVGGRLVGGVSGHGGLADVRHIASDYRNRFIGFRFQVAFPQK